MNQTPNTPEDTECIHGIETAWCSLCKPPAPVRTIGEQYDNSEDGHRALYGDMMTRDSDGDRERMIGYIIKWTIGRKIIWVAHPNYGPRKLSNTLRTAKAYISAQNVAWNDREMAEWVG